MPLIHITTSAAMDPAQSDAIIRRVTDVVATITEKDEDYVMVLVDTARGGVGGRPQPVAFVDVRAIGGLYEAINAKLSAALCTLLADALRVPPDAIYLTFTSYHGENWGWNGRTFD
ncbi:MAG: hypothetical protein K8T26_00865 [Lentisphaerae bacterium]|nr:hypothetical protein [Lentisphaerota bacterium]